MTVIDHSTTPGTPVAMPRRAISVTIDGEALKVPEGSTLLVGNSSLAGADALKNQTIRPCDHYGRDEAARTLFIRYVPHQLKYSLHFFAEWRAFSQKAVRVDSRCAIQGIDHQAAVIRDCQQSCYRNARQRFQARVL